MLEHFAYLPKFAPKKVVAVFVVLVILNEIRKGYFSQFLPRAKQAFGAFRLRPVLIALAALTLFSLADAWISHAIQSANHTFISAWATAGHQIGKNTLAGLITLYALTFLIRLDPRQRIFIFGAMLSSVLTGLATTALKFTILRARPAADLGPFSFFNLAGFTQDERLFQSFPSGDVAMIAGATGYLFHRLPHWRLRGLVFLLPLSTALARVAYNRHWPTDTITSVLLGLALSYWVQKLEQAQPGRPS